MTQEEPDPQESTLPSRTVNAAIEKMEVLTDGPDFVVRKLDDGERPSYRVFSNGQGCECDDYHYRRPAGGCKHMRRVQMVIGNIRVPTENELPEGETVDPYLLVQRDQYAAKQSLTDTEDEKIITDGGIQSKPLSDLITTDEKPESEASIELHGMLSNLLLPDDGADLDIDFYPYCAVVDITMKMVTRIADKEADN